MVNRKGSQEGTPFLNSIPMHSIGAVVIIQAYSESARKELALLGPTANQGEPIPPISAEAWWEEYHPKRRNE